LSVDRLRPSGRALNTCLARWRHVKQPRTFHLVVERDEDGFYVASVPELPGCHTQAPDLETLEDRAREAIELYLDSVPAARGRTRVPRFVGVHTVEV